MRNWFNQLPPWLDEALFSLLARKAATHHQKRRIQIHGNFYQTGVISTLHRLKAFDQQYVENDLVQFSRKNKIALVLPAGYAELSRPALDRIVETLKTVPYLNEIVIALDRATAAQFEHAKVYFSRLPQMKPPCLFFAPLCSVALR